MRFSLLLFLFVTIGTLHAQITVTNSVFPEAGDTIFVATDFEVEEDLITAPGGDQTWDFSNLDADVLSTRLVLDPAASGNDTIFPDADLVITDDLVENGAAFFTVSPTAFTQIGVLGEDPLGVGLQFATPYLPGETILSVPLNFFDQSISTYNINVQFDGDLIPDTLLAQLPISVAVDSVRVRVQNDRVDLVDAWGSLTTPAGTFEVLRQKRITTQEIIVEVQLPILGWFDITNQLPIPQLGTNSSASYYFVSDMEDEPIAVVYMDSLSEDVVNRVEFKAGNTVNTRALPQLTELEVSPNPAPGVATVRAILPTAGYRLRVVDALGRTALQTALRNSAVVNERIELPSGTYYIGVFGADNRLIGRAGLLVE